MTVKGNSTKYKKFSFIVEVDSVESAAFAKCSELSVEIEKVEQWEGGKLTPHKSPGRLTFSDITLERGATADKDLYNWFADVAKTSSGLGLNEPDYKRNIDTVQLDRDGSELRRWTVYNAWPTKFVAGDWDNSAGENLVESVTLTYDHFEISK